jgi:hypothetical protein
LPPPMNAMGSGAGSGEWEVGIEFINCLHL